ncbi:hypothetical protein CFP59_08270 [Streptomyces malaysiensis subsp. malaysiensis]|nr:hypothetical protein CFP59_08270 [Streptomyces sp. M56]SCF96515.1 hypothetical protein GA0115260_1051010 [Streptomyces sp. MnatMP-M27]
MIARASAPFSPLFPRYKWQVNLTGPATTSTKAPGLRGHPPIRADPPRGTGVIHAPLAEAP